MAVYASTFTNGLEQLIKEALPSLLKGCQVLEIYSGLIVYRYNGKPDALDRVNVFANTYLVLLELHRPTFATLVNMTESHAETNFGGRLRYGQTFRLRFQKNGKLEKIDNPTREKAEKWVKQQTRLRENRETPDWEFWYIIRSEGMGFFCLQLNKREATERTLPQGMLRPELASAMCLYANCAFQDVIMDPFAGHGAIPKALLTSRKYDLVLMGDSDASLVRKLRGQFRERIEEGKAAAYVWDALDLAEVEDASVDRVITDPPWGVYDAKRYPDMQAFSNAMMAELLRVLKPGGVCVLLSGAKQETVRAAYAAGFEMNGHMDVLVNGKKASVFRFRKPGSTKRFAPKTMED